MNIDEQHTIQLAQRGDSRALALVLREHYPFLYKYSLKITMHLQTAEDLTQETMLRCVEKIRLYNGSSKFSSWLITIATNLYMDQLRRAKRERSWNDSEIADTRLLKRQFAHEKEGWTDLMEALSQLTREMRTPIILKHYYGYSYDEIAQMMDVPLGTIKSRIHNGLQQMRKEMDEG